MVNKNYKIKNHIIMGYLRRIFENNKLNLFNMVKHYILPNDFNLKLLIIIIKIKI